METSEVNTRKRGRAMRALAAGLTAATLCQSPALADEAMAERLDAVIDRWVSSERIVGLAAIVARDDDVIYHRNAGHADRETGRPVTDDTIFRLASMTKAMTSATALALVEEGRLSLDDSVARWLPYFTPALPDGRVPEITVRQLMTHTSGLSYPFFEPDADPAIFENVPSGLERSEGTLEDAMRAIAAMPLFYEPGTEWRYSVSIDVLGAVIEAASGMTLPEAIDRYVTGPLEMTETAFVAVDPARLATAYRDGSDRAELLEEGGMIPIGVGVSPARALDPAAWPAGGAGMTGTARDYLRFLEAIRQGGEPILSAESVHLLTTHQIGELRALSEGPGWGHGLGAAVLVDPEAAGSPQNAGTWQWGGVLGTHWFVDPAENLTVLVMTNTSVAGVIGEFPIEIRDAVYGVEVPSTN